ncbi:uncharacterized protein LOC107045592 [Diachasma alloeum]|uniref:uncharacterized protein LOC107045592 n=1 Tax=Diachasma alloeum TaxID=454923 RepID=UPI0007382890|nr:uncharacterized protein LOC107045592 [Diachasma alloeum]
MANLPKVHVTQAKLFVNVGVDYRGPCFLKEKKHRNRGRVKVWVAVFVCMTVKAVYLEVVSDLTTEGFMAALKRFIARRGKPLHLYSDNGSNFIGAHNEIQKLYALLQSETNNEMVQKKLSEQGIT